MIEEIIIHQKKDMERKASFIDSTLPILGISNLKLDNGILLFRDRKNIERGYRIYQDIKLFPIFNHEKEKDLVIALSEKQKDVKLTDFPKGIVYMQRDNIKKVIGQIITYYNKYQTLYSMWYNEYNVDLNDIKWQIINIIEELLDNGIIYKDIHGRNLMVNDGFDLVKLIDFEAFAMDFTNSKSSNDSMKLMINQLVVLLNRLNTGYHLDYKYDECHSLDDIKRLTKLHQ